MNFFWSPFPTKRRPRKVLEKFGAKFRAKSGTKISKKIRETFILQLFCEIQRNTSFKVFSGAHFFFKFGGWNLHTPQIWVFREGRKNFKNSGNFRSVCSFSDLTGPNNLGDSAPLRARCGRNPSVIFFKASSSMSYFTSTGEFPANLPLHLRENDTWRVPNAPGANPLVAERAPWRSSQSCVTGGQQPIGNPYRFKCHFFCTPGNLCATPIVTRGEGSFRYQGVSTRGVRHAPGHLFMGRIPSTAKWLPKKFGKHFFM